MQHLYEQTIQFSFICNFINTFFFKIGQNHYGSLKKSYNFKIE